MSSAPVPSQGSFARISGWARAHPFFAALLVVSGLAAAAIVITYPTASTLSTTTTPAPIQFLPGDDAGPALLSTYVSAYSISSNKTYITATVKGVPEATLLVGSFFKLTNVDAASHAVTLSTSNVTNGLVSSYTIGIYDGGGSLVDTLDLRAGTSTVTATATIPAGQTYSARLTLGLATGAGANNVDLSNAMTLSFT